MTTDSQENQISDIRNIGVFAHIDAGKTTISEAILYHTGRIHKVGRIDDGNTQLDWMEQERNRGITITSAATTCTWNGCRINLIDTPGHIDFSSEVIRSIRVIDSAVILLCGVGGIESQTETIWRYADDESVPRLLFVNKLDRETADYDRVQDSIRSQLARNAVSLYIPVYRDAKLTAVASVISADDDRNMDDRTRAQKRLARTQLIDTLCDVDDEILEICLDGEPNEMQLKTSVRRAVSRREIVPVCCGSAIRNVGVPELLDAIISYLPSPRVKTFGSSSMATGGQLCRSDRGVSLHVFKTITDRHIGQLSWIKLLSGKLESGCDLYNQRSGEVERIGGIYRLHANKRERTPHIHAGDVAAVAGLRSAKTGDGYADSPNDMQHAEYNYPEPIISLSLEADDLSNAEKLVSAVSELCRDDPTLESRFEPRTGELVLAGMGELHLEVAIDRIRSEHGINTSFGSARVSYREAIRKRVEATGEYRKQTGGRGHYAVVRLAISPMKPGSGVVFEVDSKAIVSGGSPTVSGHGRVVGLLKEHVGPIETGLRDACRESLHTRNPMTDIKAILLGGKYHHYDSAKRDFEIAASFALREAVRLVGTVVLEPVMRIEANVENCFLGNVLSDLGRRRAKIHHIDTVGERMRIRGEVPLAETQKYATDIRNLTEGKGTFSLEFARYMPDKAPKSGNGA